MRQERTEAAANDSITAIRIACYPTVPFYDVEHDGGK